MNYHRHFLVRMERDQRICALGDGARVMLCEPPLPPRPCVNVLKLIKRCDDGISEPTSPVSPPPTPLMSGYVTR